MIIRESLLREDLLYKLMDEYEYSEDEANKWVDEHLESVINEMYDTESRYVSMHAESKG